MKKSIIFVLINVLLLCSCSTSKINIVDNKERYKISKVTLNLPNSHIVSSINPKKIDGLLKMVQPNELFDINEINLNNKFIYKDFAMVYNNVYFSALDKNSVTLGIYQIVEKIPTLIYASPADEILKLIAKDGMLFFVEKTNDFITLKVFDINNKSIKIVSETENKNFYNLYDCADYIAFTCETINAYQMDFINIKNNKLVSEYTINKNSNIIISVQLVTNNIFAYRDTTKSTLCFFDIDNNKVSSTFMLDTLVCHDYLLCKIVKDTLIMRDGDGIDVYSFKSDEKTEIFYDLTPIEKNIVDLIDNTALFFVNDNSFFACDYIKGEQTVLFRQASEKYLYSNNIDTFITSNGNKIKIYFKK